MAPRKPARMRVILVVLALIAAGCLTSPRPQDSAAGVGTEFHPAWRSGGEVVWDQGAHLANATVPAGWQWASDGKTFLYATSDPRSHDALAVAKCGGVPARPGSWVLVNVTACSWAQHPAVACDLPESGAGPCEPAWRLAPPGTNIFHPLWHEGPGHLVWTRWDGSTVDVNVPKGGMWATDGHTYLYATNSLISHDGPEAQACWKDHAGYGPVVVLIEVSGCSIGAHPAIACGGWQRGADPCTNVTGPGPSPPG